nr:hypothetical protein [[Eubacterium] tenue]
MTELIKELLPYIKTFAGLYLILYVIGGTLAIVFTVWIFKTVIREHREFDKNFNKRWKK